MFQVQRTDLHSQMKCWKNVMNQFLNRKLQCIRLLTLSCAKEKPLAQDLRKLAIKLQQKFFTLSAPATRLHEDNLDRWTSVPSFVRGTAFSFPAANVSVAWHPPE